VDTAAGQAVNGELIRLAQTHKRDLERVKMELHEALEERDHEMQRFWSSKSSGWTENSKKSANSKNSFDMTAMSTVVTSSLSMTVD
jgi:hypothetical protein